jgi:hypothetical protein
MRPGPGFVALTVRFESPAGRNSRSWPPVDALGNGLARELDIMESYLEKLAEEVRKDLGASRLRQAVPHLPRSG